MLESISLTEETSAFVLTTQRYLKEGSFLGLLAKAQAYEFNPNPPVILTPLPSIYKGRFKWHLYNGHNRFAVANLVGVPLNAIVVDSDADIPASDRLQITIDERLATGLYTLLRRRHIPSHMNLKELSLDALLTDLEAAESAALTQNPHPILVASE